MYVNILEDFVLEYLTDIPSPGLQRWVPKSGEKK